MGCYHHKAVLLTAVFIWLLGSVVLIILAPTVMVHRWNVTMSSSTLYPGGQKVYIPGGSTSQNMYVDSSCPGMVTYEYDHHDLPENEATNSTTSKKVILAPKTTFSHCFSVNADERLSCSFELSHNLSVTLIERSNLEFFKKNHWVNEYSIFQPNFQTGTFVFRASPYQHRFLCWVSYNSIENETVSFSSKCAVTDVQYNCAKKKPLNMCRKQSCRFKNVEPSNEIVINYEIETGTETEECDVSFLSEKSEMNEGSIAALVVSCIVAATMIVSIICLIHHWA